jgi:tetratricopeptide (TPR) repeat protein
MTETEKFTFYSIIAQTYLKVGNFSYAVEWYKRALDLAFQANNLNDIFLIYNNIATIFTEAKDYDRALRYTQYTEEMLDKGYTVSDESLARFYANAGVTYRRTGQLGRAEEYYFKSLAISESNNFIFKIAQNHSNLGNLYKDKADYKAALDSYSISLRISEATNNLFGEIVNYINMGSAYRLMGEYDKALNVLSIAENLLVNTSMPSIKRILFNEFVQLSKATGDYELSVTYKELYDVVDQQIGSLEKQNELLRSQNALDLKVIEREMSLQRAQFGAIQSMHRVWLVIFSMSLMFSGLFIFLLKRKQRTLYQQKLESFEITPKPAAFNEAAQILQMNVNLLEAKPLKDFSSNENSPKDESETRKLFVNDVIHQITNTAVPPDALLDNDSIDNDMLEDIYQKVMDHFNKEKLYTNSELTLDSFAVLLGTNKKYLSLSINHKSGRNFNDFVNSYRVKFAVRLLMDDRDRNLTLKQLQSKCGFGSEATFYRAFKQFTGFTPIHFKREHRLKVSSKPQ